MQKPEESFIHEEEFQHVGRTIFIKSKMILFAYILIISTRIFIILTFFYQVIILLKLPYCNDRVENVNKGYIISILLHSNYELLKLCLTELNWDFDVNDIDIYKLQFLLKILTNKNLPRNNIWKYVLETWHWQLIKLCKKCERKKKYFLYT